MAPAAARDKDKLDRFRRDVEQCMGVAFEELDDATSRGSSATSSSASRGRRDSRVRPSLARDAISTEAHPHAGTLPLATNAGPEGTGSSDRAWHRLAQDRARFLPSSRKNTALPGRHTSSNALGMIAKRLARWLAGATVLLGATACSHAKSSDACETATASTTNELSASSGNCSGAEFVPPSNACFQWDCDNGATWHCDAGAPVEGGAACGATPPDYNGCLQWSCDNGPCGGWRGQWLCNDCLKDCSVDGGAAGCAYVNSGVVGCYCYPPAAMPDTGGWVCSPAPERDY
jgi:hypothetical protein